MFERPANGIAALIAVGAIGVSAYRALLGGVNPYALAATVLGVAMLLVGAWWLSRQAPGTPFHDMAIPAAVATVVPVLVGSGLNTILGASDVASWMLVAAAAATLGLAIADRLPESYRAAASLLVA